MLFCRRLALWMKDGAVMAILILAVACGAQDGRSAHNDILVSIGDSLLTREAVVRRIPVGLSESDSAALFGRIVDSWIESMVLEEMAREKLPDLEEIERKVAHYRNRLIVSDYLSRMRRSNSDHPSPDSVRSFYDLHRGEMLAERPLVKGLFVKVGEKIDGLEEIRRCIQTADDASIDLLERQYASDVSQYEYFEKTWVDWQTIAELIPYRFYDPDAFVNSTSDFETSYNGNVYLLHISEYLPTGSELPFEFAAPRIEAMLEQSGMTTYTRRLVESLVKEAVNDGRLVGVGYDPVARKVVSRPPLSKGETNEKRKLKNEK